MRSLGHLVYRLAVVGGIVSVATVVATLVLHRQGRLTGWRRRATTTVIAASLLVGVVSAAAAGWRSYSLRRLLDASTKVEVDTLRPDAARPVGPVNFLVLGSDARSIPGYAEDPAGEVEGERADVLMVLKIDPAVGKAVVLSLPRDLYVEIPGHGPGKINAALDLGGPSLQVRTVQEVTGIPIDHYVEVEFTGFVDIVDTLGGVELCIAHPMADETVGIDLGQAGCHLVDGINALNFVRSRTPEFLIDGEWVQDPDGDLGRIKRQQHFLEELMKKALARGVSHRAPQYASALGRALTFDSGFGGGDVENLIEGFSRPSPDGVTFHGLPGVTDQLDGVSYVFAKQPDADVLLMQLGGHAIPDSALPFGR